MTLHFPRRNKRLTQKEAEAQLRAAYGEYWGQTESGWPATLPDEDAPKIRHRIGTWIAGAALVAVIAWLAVHLSGVVWIP